MQNNKSTSVFFNISVKTGKLYASYRRISGMHTFVNGHPLVTIAQSIPRVFCQNLVKAAATYEALSFSTNKRFTTSSFQVMTQKYTDGRLLM